jgi:hypothetical protein
VLTEIPQKRYVVLVYLACLILEPSLWPELFCTRQQNRPIRGVDWNANHTTFFEGFSPEAERFTRRDKAREPRSESRKQSLGFLDTGVEIWQTFDVVEMGNSIEGTVGRVERVERNLSIELGLKGLLHPRMLGQIVAYSAQSTGNENKGQFAEKIKQSLLTGSSYRFQQPETPLPRL